MKYILVALFAALSTAAVADTGNILFQGTVSTACAFTSGSLGALDITGTAVTTTTPGSIDVTNNDPGTYTLALGSASLIATGGQDFTAAPTVTPTVAGVNAGITLPATLTNAGTDTVSVTVTGTLDATATSGSYDVTQVITCDPV